jgi:hypothetical protein
MRFGRTSAKTGSVFDGPEPVIPTFADQAHEIAVVAAFMTSEGMGPERSASSCDSAAHAPPSKPSAHPPSKSPAASGEPTRVSVGTMHYAKGLENSGASLIDSTPNCLRNSDSESHEPCSEPRAKALSLSNSGHPVS